MYERCSVRNARRFCFRCAVCRLHHKYNNSDQQTKYPNDSTLLSFMSFVAALRFFALFRFILIYYILFSSFFLNFCVFFFLCVAVDVRPLMLMSVFICAPSFHPIALFIFHHSSRLYIRPSVCHSHQQI